MSLHYTIPSFVPIVTTYTVSSEEQPLERLVNDSRLLSQAFLEYRQKAGYSCFPILGDSTFTAEAFGCKIGFKTHEAVVLTPLSFSSKDEIEDYPVPAVKECKRLELILRAVKEMSTFASPWRPLITNSTAPLTTLSNILGIENLLKGLVKTPDLIQALLGRVTDFILSLSLGLIDAGSQIIFIAEPVASTDLISPEMFKNFVLTHLKRLISSISIPTILHICGDIFPIVSDVTDSGATILSVDQCVDLNQIREAVGKGVFLGGNIDPGEILYYGRPEDVVEASRECIRMGGTERFLLMPGCTIVPGTPFENIRAMVDVAGELLVPQKIDQRSECFKVPKVS